MSHTSLSSRTPSDACSLLHQFHDLPPQTSFRRAHDRHVAKLQPQHQSRVKCPQSRQGCTRKSFHFVCENASSVYLQHERPESGEYNKRHHELAKNWRTCAIDISTASHNLCILCSDGPRCLHRISIESATAAIVTSDCCVCQILHSSLVPSSGSSVVNTRNCLANSSLVSSKRILSNPQVPFVFSNPHPSLPAYCTVP